MADVKISALPAATTPLAGTELVPIVQGGVTAQVTVANMTAGRSVAASTVAASTVAASTVNVDANTASAAVRITQLGAGSAILVEDSANPDATPFVVDSAGSVGIGTTAPGALLNVVAGTTFDAVRITQTGNGNALTIEDNTNPDSTPIVFDNSGRFVVGHPTVLALAPSGAIPSIQLNVSVPSTDFASTGNSNWVAGAQGAGFVLAKSRSGVVGTPGIVASGDAIGRINFTADDGVKFLSAARVEAQVDGTPGLDDMPGRLVFLTTADGAAGPVERMRINNVGFITTNGSLGRAAPSTQTGNFTLADNVNWVICNGAGTITVTLPAASSWAGREVMIKTIAAQTVVSASSNVVPLAGGAAGTAILPASAGAWATLVSDGTNWIIMQS